MAVGRLEQAIQAIEQAIELRAGSLEPDDPRLLSACEIRADILDAMNRKDEAELLRNRIARLSQSPD